MKRLETIDFQSRPFYGRFLTKAEPGYKGYFHSHPGLEILFVHEGQGVVTLPQHVYPIQPGTMFIFQPYQLHHVRATHTEEYPYIRSLMQFDPVAIHSYVKPYKQLEQMLMYIWKGNLKQQAFPGMHLRYPIEPNIRYYKEQMTAITDKDYDRYASLVALMLQYLQSEIEQLSIPINTTTPLEMTHTEAILRWIEQYYAEPFDLSRLADELHLSKYHISHLFKEDTGQTVTDYILALRSKEACRLLVDTTLPVAEVGVRVGWPIASHFTQQFKRWVGCTPSQYRKRYRLHMSAGVFDD